VRVHLNPMEIMILSLGRSLGQPRSLEEERKGRGGRCHMGPSYQRDKQRGHAVSESEGERARASGLGRVLGPTCAWPPEEQTGC